MSLIALLTQVDLKSPVQKLHSALSSPLTKLAMALKQVADQKA